MFAFRRELALSSIAAVVACVAVDAGLAQPVTPDVGPELQVARQVMNAARMQRAFEYVDGSEAETVREWLSICNAYGPQADEIQRSRLLYKLFRIYGLENVHIDDARNVIGIRPGVGEGPTVVLNAHHDNVALWPRDQPIEAFVADNRVWCPAAGDDLMGVTQLLTVLRALNAADIQTDGDIWFVSFVEEEVGGVGAGQFVRANYPHNIDWRNGDILSQFHGGGGEGMTTGSNPYAHLTQLRIFVPLDFDRWRTDAVDALGLLIQRINDELRDPRSTGVSEYETGVGEMTSELLYLNMAMVQGNVIHNGTSNEAWIRFDLRAPSEARLWQAHEDIQRIAAEVCQEMGEGYEFLYEINMKLGVEGIDGWDKVNNAPARMAAAAARALYGTEPVIDPTRGCGDCRRMYMAGMPAMSLRGNVVDFGGGRFEVRRGRGGALQSAVRRKSAGHDVTESAEIVRLWSGIKHGLLFAVSYTGLAN
jgi:acetylornithine deacetylase/succinyl-diaminopimelate desuccinylase-like protein